MSSILKALKKVEEEKSAPREGKINVARGIVRDLPRTTGRSRWVLPVSVAVAAFGAGLLTYVLTGMNPSRDREPSPVAPPQVVSESGGGDGQIRVSVPEPRDGKSRPADERAMAAPSKPSSPERQPLPITATALRKRASSSPAETPGRSGEPPAEGTDGRNVRELPKNAGNSIQMPGVHPFPALKVSGIAWQKDGSERLAVVNGSPVSEGMTVEGARVEGIYPDKVRFSFERRTFDVAVGKEDR